MALRSIIPIEDIRVAHVNSDDNSTAYESGVAYKAGTLVTYEGAAYVAAADIAEDDTDLPNAAPLKWGLVPNAFTSGGDDSGLASRVSALEEDMTTAQADIIDLQSHGNVSIDTVQVTVESGKTIVEALTALGDAALAYVQALEDDEVAISYFYYLPLLENGSSMAFHCVESERYNTATAVRFDVSDIRCSANATNIDIYCARFGDSSVTAQSMQMFSTSDQTTANLGIKVLTDSISPYIRFMRFNNVT